MSETTTIEAPPLNVAPEGAESGAVLPPHTPNKALASMPRAGANPIAAIIPQTMDEAYRMAKVIAIAGWAPKSYLIDQNNASLGFSPEKIMIAIMQGLEVGLSPMASVQSIAVINGMPSLWGDGALAVVRASGLIEDFKEERLVDAAGKFRGYRCTALRVGEPEPAMQEFTMDDAKLAKLDQKAGPWQNYPQRMCQMRARAWVLRDKFTDSLKGFKIAEEALDMVIDMGEADEVAPRKRRQISSSARAQTLDQFAGAATNSGLEAAPEKQKPTKNDQAPDTIAPSAGNKSAGTDQIGNGGFTMPAAAAKQFREQGKWMPAYSWLSATLPTISDPTVRQEFVSTFADYFQTARSHSAAYEKTVDKLLKENGVTLDPTDET
jgi:hypothetical protein